MHDTGIGIPPEARKHIFDPFSQVDGSITRQYGGTGLGLAIAKELIRMMGGAIGVESNPGTGSIFWFTALFQPCEDGKQLPETVSSPVVAPVRDRKDVTRSVLLVEDNPVNQEVAVAMLEYCGCTVDMAKNGREAIGAFSQKRYDMILMDCQMPEMDGYEATAVIRDMERKNGEHGLLCHTPIVALTAHAMEGDREQCLRAGMDDYLAKPFNVAKLQSILDKWIAATPAEKDNPSAPEQAGVDGLKQ